MEHGKTSITSADSATSLHILQLIHNSFLDRSYQTNAYWKVADIKRIFAEDLERGFRGKKIELQPTRCRDDIRDEFLFTCYNSSEHIDAIANKGLLVQQSRFNFLGNSSLGVILCKHADVQLKAAQNENQGRCWLMVFKVMYGLKVAVEPTGDVTRIPTIGADCHVSSLPPLVTESLGCQAIKSQVYLYEIDTRSSTGFSLRPRQCVPQAYIEFVSTSRRETAVPPVIAVSLPNILNHRRLSGSLSPKAAGSGRMEVSSCASTTTFTVPVTGPKNLSAQRTLVTSRKSKKTATPSSQSQTNQNVTVSVPPKNLPSYSDALKQGRVGTQIGLDAVGEHIDAGIVQDARLHLLSLCQRTVVRLLQNFAKAMNSITGVWKCSGCSIGNTPSLQSAVAAVQSLRHNFQLLAPICQQFYKFVQDVCAGKILLFPSIILLQRQLNLLNTCESLMCNVFEKFTSLFAQSAIQRGEMMAKAVLSAKDLLLECLSTVQTAIVSLIDRFHADSTSDVLQMNGPGIVQNLVNPLLNSGSVQYNSPSVTGFQQASVETGNSVYPNLSSLLVFALGNSSNLNNFMQTPATSAAVVVQPSEFGEHSNDNLTDVSVSRTWSLQNNASSSEERQVQSSLRLPIVIAPDNNMTDELDNQNTSLGENESAVPLLASIKQEKIEVSCRRNTKETIFLDADEIPTGSCVIGQNIKVETCHEPVADVSENCINDNLVLEVVDSSNPGSTVAKVFCVRPEDAANIDVHGELQKTTSQEETMMVSKSETIVSSETTVAAGVLNVRTVNEQHSSVCAADGTVLCLSLSASQSAAKSVDPVVAKKKSSAANRATSTKFNTAASRVPSCTKMVKRKKQSTFGGTKLFKRNLWSHGVYLRKMFKMLKFRRFLKALKIRSRHRTAVDKRSSSLQKVSTCISNDDEIKFGNAKSQPVETRSKELSHEEIPMKHDTCDNVLDEIAAEVCFTTSQNDVRRTVIGSVVPAVGGLDKDADARCDVLQSRPINLSSSKLSNREENKNSFCQLVDGSSNHGGLSVVTVKTEPSVVSHDKDQKLVDGQTIDTDVIAEVVASTTECSDLSEESGVLKIKIENVCSIAAEGFENMSLNNSIKSEAVLHDFAENVNVAKVCVLPEPNTCNASSEDHADLLHSSNTVVKEQLHQDEEFVDVGDTEYGGVTVNICQTLVKNDKNIKNHKMLQADDFDDSDIEVNYSFENLFDEGEGDNRQVDSSKVDFDGLENNEEILKFYSLGGDDSENVEVHTAMDLVSSSVENKVHVSPTSAVLNQKTKQCGGKSNGGRKKRKKSGQGTKVRRKSKTANSMSAQMEQAVSIEMAVENSVSSRDADCVVREFFNPDDVVQPKKKGRKCRKAPEGTSARLPRSRKVSSALPVESVEVCSDNMLNVSEKTEDVNIGEFTVLPSESLDMNNDTVSDKTLVESVEAADNSLLTEEVENGNIRVESPEVENQSHQLDVLANPAESWNPAAPVTGEELSFQNSEEIKISSDVSENVKKRKKKRKKRSARYSATNRGRQPTKILLKTSEGTDALKMQDEHILENNYAVMNDLEQVEALTNELEIAENILEKVNLEASVSKFQGIASEKNATVIEDYLCNFPSVNDVTEVGNHSITGEPAAPRKTRKRKRGRSSRSGQKRRKRSGSLQENMIHLNANEESSVQINLSNPENAVTQVQQMPSDFEPEKLLSEMKLMDLHKTVLNLLVQEPTSNEPPASVVRRTSPRKNAVNSCEEPQTNKRKSCSATVIPRKRRRKNTLSQNSDESVLCLKNMLQDESFLKNLKTAVNTVSSSTANVTEGSGAVYYTDIATNIQDGVDNMLFGENVSGENCIQNDCNEYLKVEQFKSEYLTEVSDSLGSTGKVPCSGSLDNDLGKISTNFHTAMDMVGSSVCYERIRSALQTIASSGRTASEEQTSFGATSVQSLNSKSFSQSKALASMSMPPAMDVSGSNCNRSNDSFTDKSTANHPPAKTVIPVSVYLRNARQASYKQLKESEGHSTLPAFYTGVIQDNAESQTTPQIGHGYDQQNHLILPTAPSRDPRLLRMQRSSVDIQPLMDVKTRCDIDFMNSHFLAENNPNEENFLNFPNRKHPVGFFHSVSCPEKTGQPSSATKKPVGSITPFICKPSIQDESSDISKQDVTVPETQCVPYRGVWKLVPVSGLLPRPPEIFARLPLAERKISELPSDPRIRSDRYLSVCKHLKRPDNLVDSVALVISESDVAFSSKTKHKNESVIEKEKRIFKKSFEQNIGVQKKSQLQDSGNGRPKLHGEKFPPSDDILNDLLSGLDSEAFDRQKSENKESSLICGLNKDRVLGNRNHVVPPSHVKHDLKPVKRSRLLEDQPSSASRLSRDEIRTSKRDVSKVKGVEQKTAERKNRKHHEQRSDPSKERLHKHHSKNVTHRSKIDSDRKDQVHHRKSNDFACSERSRKPAKPSTPAHSDPAADRKTHGTKSEHHSLSKQDAATKSEHHSLSKQDAATKSEHNCLSKRDAAIHALKLDPLLRRSLSMNHKSLDACRDRQNHSKSSFVRSEKSKNNDKQSGVRHLDETRVTQQAQNKRDRHKREQLKIHSSVSNLLATDDKAVLKQDESKISGEKFQSKQSVSSSAEMQQQGHRLLDKNDEKRYRSCEEIKIPNKNEEKHQRNHEEIKIPNKNEEKHHESHEDIKMAIENEYTKLSKNLQNLTAVEHSTNAENSEKIAELGKLCAPADNETTRICNSGAVSHDNESTEKNNQSYRDEAPTQFGSLNSLASKRCDGEAPVEVQRQVSHMSEEDENESLVIHLENENSGVEDKTSDGLCDEISLWKDGRAPKDDAIDGANSPLPDCTQECFPVAVKSFSVSNIHIRAEILRSIKNLKLSLEDKIKSETNSAQDPQVDLVDEDDNGNVSPLQSAASVVSRDQEQFRIKASNNDVNLSGVSKILTEKRKISKVDDVRVEHLAKKANLVNTIDLNCQKVCANASKMDDSESLMACDFTMMSDNRAEEQHNYEERAMNHLFDEQCVEKNASNRFPTGVENCSTPLEPEMHGGDNSVDKLDRLIENSVVADLPISCTDRNMESSSSSLHAQHVHQPNDVVHSSTAEADQIQFTCQDGNNSKFELSNEKPETQNLPANATDSLASCSSQGTAPTTGTAASSKSRRRAFKVIDEWSCISLGWTEMSKDYDFPDGEVVSKERVSDYIKLLDDMPASEFATLSETLKHVISEMEQKITRNLVFHDPCEGASEADIRKRLGSKCISFELEQEFRLNCDILNLDKEIRIVNDSVEAIKYQMCAHPSLALDKTLEEQEQRYNFLTVKKDMYDHDLLQFQRYHKSNLIYVIPDRFLLESELGKFVSLEGVLLFLRSPSIPLKSCLRLEALKADILLVQDELSKVSIGQQKFIKRMKTKLGYLHFQRRFALKELCCLTPQHQHRTMCNILKKRASYRRVLNSMHGRNKTETKAVKSFIFKTFAIFDQYVDVLRIAEKTNERDGAWRISLPAEGPKRPVVSYGSSSPTSNKRGKSKKKWHGGWEAPSACGWPATDDGSVFGQEAHSSSMDYDDRYVDRRDTESQRYDNFTEVYDEYQLSVFAPNDADEGLYNDRRGHQEQHYDDAQLKDEQRGYDDGRDYARNNFEEARRWDSGNRSDAYQHVMDGRRIEVNSHGMSRVSRKAVQASRGRELRQIHLDN